jgi:hypothetical protein
MSQLPFFTWHNILRAAVVGAVGVGRVFYACRFSLALGVVAAHNNMRYAWLHGMRSVRLPRFGDTFQWRKSSVCCFGALICNCGARRRQLHSRRRQLHSARRLLPSRCQQMAALNFFHFYFMKGFVKIDREVTSNIKLKKYKIVNKKVLIAYVLF